MRFLWLPPTCAYHGQLFESGDDGFEAWSMSPLFSYHWGHFVPNSSGPALQCQFAGDGYLNPASLGRLLNSDQWEKLDFSEIMDGHMVVLMPRCIHGRCARAHLYGLGLNSPNVVLVGDRILQVHDVGAKAEMVMAHENLEFMVRFVEKLTEEDLFVNPGASEPIVNLPELIAEVQNPVTDEEVRQINERMARVHLEENADALLQQVTEMMTSVQLEETPNE